MASQYSARKGAFKRFLELLSTLDEFLWMVDDNVLPKFYLFAFEKDGASLRGREAPERPAAARYGRRDLAGVCDRTAVCLSRESPLFAHTGYYCEYGTTGTRS